MAKKDPRIDAYIEKAQPFARPILKHLRKVVHIGSPDVVETMKSHRREYVDWLVDAKSEETRSRRLETALKWLSEGKSRNWKYERK